MMCYYLNVHFQGQRVNVLVFSVLSSDLEQPLGHRRKTMLLRCEDLKQRDIDVCFPQLRNILY